MNETQGTLATAAVLRTAYIGTRNRSEFVAYCVKKFAMDQFMAELIWETIDIVADLGADKRS